MTRQTSTPFPIPELHNLATIGASTKMCCSCKEVLPLDQFKDRINGNGSLGKMSFCTNCKHDAKRIIRSNRYEQVRNEATRAVMERIAARKIDAPHISELCESMVKLFGGVDQLAVFWYGQIQHAASIDPGSKRVLDSCVAMRNLIQASTELRPSAPDQQLMSEADLQTEMTSIMLQIMDDMEENPALEMANDPPGVDDEQE